MMAMGITHPVDVDKAPEPVRSTLRALHEMGYAVSSWDMDSQIAHHRFGSRLGDGFMPTGLVEFTIHISAVGGLPRPTAAPEPGDDEFGDDFTGEEVAAPLSHIPRRLGWLPGDDDHE